MNGSSPKQSARDLLAEAHPALVGLSHWIHANPELGYEETLAAGWVAEWLSTAGFEVQTGMAGMETALRGSFGPGPFHVVICAEYDALPAVGHACGHNVIAAASVGAAIALASVADELGLRVTLLGTPAEEGGGGKLQLIKAGAFESVHAALMVHPGPEDVAQPQIIAVQQIEVTYTGREAHASAYPEEGVNAADAMVIAQAAIGLLRQQLQTGDRVHGIVTGGGEAPNIIPAHTSARYMTRAATRERQVELTLRVRRCFEAGALATGAELSFEEGIAYAPMVHDPDLLALYVNNAQAIGRVFDPNATLIASTDMGDVSHVVPSIHPIIGIDSRPAVNHQPDFAAAAVSEAADQAIFDGALALAWTVIDAAQDVALRDRLTGNTSAHLVLDAEQAEAVTEPGAYITSEATPEIVDAYVVVEGYVVEPMADDVGTEIEAAAFTDATASDAMTDEGSPDPWSPLEPAEDEPIAAAEAVSGAWTTEADAETPAEITSELADPWAVSATEVEAQVADPWTQPTAELADPWAVPATEAAASYEPGEATESQFTASNGDNPSPSWSEFTDAVSEAASSEATGNPETVAEAAEAAPDRSYAFGQAYGYQPADLIAETEAVAATDSPPAMEWVTEPMIEPVVETGPEYSWFQPTTTAATTYEPLTDSLPAEPIQDVWGELVGGAPAETGSFEAIAEPHPIAEPEPVYGWMLPTETESDPIVAVAESGTEPTQDWAEQVTAEADTVEAVAETEPAGEAAVESDPVEAIAEADLSETFAEFQSEAESERVEAIAESTEAASEYAWMQPVEAEAEDIDAEVENPEAVAEFTAVAEPSGEGESVEAAAGLDGTPFDNWAQQSAELPYLNGHSDESEPESAGEPAAPWAEPWTQPAAGGWAERVAEATADAWAEPVAEATEQPLADVWTQPSAEATEQPLADVWTEPSADAWAEPVVEMHAEGHNGKGSGHAWHDAPAEVEPVEPDSTEFQPITEQPRSRSVEHSSWETAFTDALAELDAKPTSVEAQSWDEAARVD